MQALHINGNDLSLENVRDVVDERRPVLLDPDARERGQAARTGVDELGENNQLAYAVTTGVGKLSDVRIAPPQIRELLVTLLRADAVGVGEPLSEGEVRAMILLRANSLAKGHSGVRPIVLDTLCLMLNRGVHPVVPSQGSVGASGDLAPLAHLALALIGEGEAFYADPKSKRPRRVGDPVTRRLPAAQATKRAGIDPLKLEAKEAISLINGTQAMVAVGSLALLQAQIMVD